MSAPKDLDVQVVTTSLPRPKSTQELITEIGAVYGVDTILALKIARCESTSKHYTNSGAILRGHKNPDDIGIFQINERYHLGASQKLGLDIYDLEDNIKYAMVLMKRDGTQPWYWSRSCWG